MGYTKDFKGDFMGNLEKHFKSIHLDEESERWPILFTLKAARFIHA